MRQGRIDFLIIGTTPLAHLLAGLLASSHGKSVLVQGDSQSRYRLARNIDLSVAAITRPESWALLAESVPETTRLVTQIGKRAAIARVDPILFANQLASQQALAHVRHMAEAYGLAVERTPVRNQDQTRDGVVLRDAVMLRRQVLDPALDVWLAKCGVRRLHAGADLAVQADGQARCTLEGEEMAVGQTILADDDAIATHLPAAMWPALLQRQVASSILTAPAHAIASPIMYQLDNGVMLNQQVQGGILAFGPGSIADFAGALGNLVDMPNAILQAGQSSYVRLITSDGAPVVGRAAGMGPDVLAGFGSIGAFFAPAIARWLCGQASPAENEWFGARLVDRHGDSRVGDIGEPR